MLKKFRQGEHGQALVEMALVLPIFLLLLFGVMEMGRVGYAYITVSNAARAGVRTATVGGTDLEIREAILNASPSLDSAKLSIQISPDESHRESGQGVTVQVSYPVQLIIPVISNLVSNPVIVGSTLSMRLE